jgi:hypothetical protein
MAENEVTEFIKYMKEEFAKIPPNLRLEELKDRAERCLSLSETFRFQGEGFKAKKYALLSERYNQLAFEKTHPKKPQSKPIQQIIIEEPIEEPRKPWMTRIFMKIFGRKENIRNNESQN